MIFQTYNPNNPQHIHAANQIEDWSRQAGSAMLPLDAERTARFRRRLFAIEAADQLLLGHVALEFRAKREVMLSGLIINPEYRSRGIASKILGQMVAEVSLLTGNLDSFTSYVNDDALQAYRNIGAEVAGLRTGEITTDCVNIVDIMPAMGRYRSDTNDIPTYFASEQPAPRLSVVRTEIIVAA